jgi:hypothetical protein
MYKPKTMMGMYRAQSAAGVGFSLDLSHRELEVTFQILYESARLPAKHRVAGDILQDYKFVVSLAQPLTAHEMVSGHQRALVISTDDPPNFFRKFNEAETHNIESMKWSVRDAWFRQTDITHGQKRLKYKPISLKKDDPIIDIGNSMFFILG